MTVDLTPNEIDAIFDLLCEESDIVADYFEAYEANPCDVIAKLKALFPTPVNDFPVNEEEN